MRFKEVVSVPLSDIDYRKPVIVTRSSRLGTVVDEMASGNRGVALITGDDGKLVGIFTEHDLARRIELRTDDWRGQAISDVMSPDPETASVDTTIRKALRSMTSGRFRHLPLVGEDGSAVGVVSIRDILVHIAGCFPKHFLNLPPDPDHEARNPWGG